jgi:hypothetical protein
LAVWDELRGVLARLRDEQPGVLMMYAMPEADEGGPSPFVIRLAPWAAATAAELHRQFGDDVELGRPICSARPTMMPAGPRR